MLAAWNRIINAFEDMYRVLRVLVMGAITTGIESGFRFAFGEYPLILHKNRMDHLLIYLGRTRFLVAREEHVRVRTAGGTGR